jgi:hypothetical protein
MKNLLLYLFLIVSVIFFTACQKELNFEGTSSTPGNGLAVGTLKSTSGNCLPSTVSGTFTKDSLLKSLNFIQVTADISTTGTYTIKSDTIAGFFFSGTGTITNTGINSINLAGNGTPASTGVKTFTVTFGSSICKIDVNVVAATPAPTAFTFTCAGTTFGPGVYTVNSAVGAQHTVTFNVVVTSPGPWLITTALVNGVLFSGSGTFTAATSTQITLTASGTPLVASPPAYNYTAASGGASCAFSITVAAAAPAPNLDYVPQTSFSNWSSKLVGGTAADTTYIQVSANSKTLGTQSYKIFEVKNMGVPTDSFFNRKNGSSYFQYIDGNLGVLTNPINKEYLVLDSNKLINDTWTAHFGANVAMGFPLSDIRVDAQILGKGETQTVQSIIYTNVIRVKYTYTATVIGLGDIPVAEEERWFAKGIGVIHSSILNLINPGTTVNETTRTQIF